MIVYCITNLKDGRRYVGKTVAPLRVRWSNHVSTAKRGSNTYLHRAIRKYGRESFSSEVLSRASNTDALNALEAFWIRKLVTRELGYNLSDGGESGSLGFRHTEETKARMSAAHKNLPANPNSLRNLQRRGHPRGVPHSADTRRRIGDAITGKKRSQEVRNKMSLMRKGISRRPLSAVTKHRISVAQKAAWKRGRNSQASESIV